MKSINKNTDICLRSPICCVLGHVDAGKTSFLDRLRKTNNQSREAGGITQSISAWNLNLNDISDYLKQYPTTQSIEDIKIPGLLMIDTPGHEAFMQLRTTGVSLCDFAILVVDIHKGIEQQTKESIRLLREDKIPFVVVLNKLDTIYGWKPPSTSNMCFKRNLENQDATTLHRLEKVRRDMMLQFAECGMNFELYYRNRDQKSVVNGIPCSAKTGEGFPDILTVILRISEKYMQKKIQFHSNDYRGLVLMEDKLIGHGECFRMLLVDGILKKGERFWCEQQSSIVKTLLTFDHQANEYKSVNSVRAACACIVVPQSCLKMYPGSEISNCESAVNEIGNINVKLAKNNDVNCFSVWIQTGSIGTMHALIKFLEDNNIPICGYNIGPIYKTHIMKIKNAGAGILPLLLNFGAVITPEAEKYALEQNVKIESSPIIYRLLDVYNLYQQKYMALLESKFSAEREEAIFPCILEIVNDCVFRNSNPIVIGVHIIEGTLAKGTPICVFKKVDNEDVCIDVGKVTQLKTEQGDSIDSAEKGKTLSVEIKSRKKVGTHFAETDRLYSKISRHSINLLKKHFKKSLNKSHVNAIILLKKKLNIG